MKNRILLSILIACLAFVYFPLNHTLTNGYQLKTALDAFIPVWSVWVIPYLLILPAWAAAMLWFTWKMDDHLFRSFAASAVFVLVIANLFYYFLPTYIVRPTLTGSNWTTSILAWVYSTDGAYNAFPSGHVFQTTLMALYLSRMYPRLSWLWGGTTATIVLATLFTHQHYLVDPIGGMLLALAGYWIGTALFPTLAKKAIPQPTLALVPVHSLGASIKTPLK
jgi:membrane-associated phospholipid phosphatase